MALPFPANPKRLDPYKNFKFRLKWDGKYVYGGSKLTGLKRTTEVVEHRNGGDPSTSHKSPGRTKYEAITLERGLTQDMAFHGACGGKFIRFKIYTLALPAARFCLRGVRCCWRGGDSGL